MPQPTRRGHRAEDHGPLLAVHVVHQRDDRGVSTEHREEGDAVLHIHDDVVGAGGTLVRTQRGDGRGIHGQPAALAAHPDPRTCSSLRAVPWAAQKKDTVCPRSARPAHTVSA